MRNLAKNLIDKGYGPFVGIPCSRLKDFLDEVKRDCMYTTSEHEAIMRAAGIATSGKKPVVFLQNSGVGDIIDPLASFLIPANVKLGAIVISNRGGDSDAPHHKYMREFMNSILTCGVPIEQVCEVYVV